MKSKFKVYLYSVLALTLLTTLLRGTLLLTGFEATIGYYAPGILPSFLYALCVACVLWILSPALFVPKHIPGLDPAAEDRPLIPQKIAGCLMLASAILMAILLFSRRNVLSLLLPLSAAISALYLFLPKSKARLPSYYIYMGFSPILTNLLMIFTVHSDMTTVLNGPVKRALLLTLSSFMLCFLCELSLLAERPRHRAYWIASLLSLFLGGVCAIPHILAFSTSILTDPFYLVIDLYLLASLIYVLARAIAFVRAVPENAEN